MSKRQSKTCIAAIKSRSGKIIMAGDRRVSADWGFAYKSPVPKIRKYANGLLIGASGDSGLCTLLVDGYEPRSIETDELTYLYYTFIKDLAKLVREQPGYQDEHKILRLAIDETCSALIAINGKLFILDIFNPEEHLKEMNLSRIVPDTVPLPFAIGCGAPSAIPILLSEKQEIGYNTRAGLKKAMEIAAEISPGCDNNIDFIQED